MYNKIIIVSLLLIACHFQQNLNSIDPTVIPAVPTIQPVVAQPAATNQGQAVPQQLNTQTNQNKQQQQAPAPAPHVNLQAQRLQQQRLTRLNEQSLRVARQQQQRLIKQQQQSYRRIKLQGQLSQTQMRKQQQSSKFKIQQLKIQEGTRFTQHLFQQHAGLNQFVIEVPVSQVLAIYFYLYVAKDNTYVRTNNIHEETPVQVYIYEDDQAVIHQGEFYFEHYIILNGKEGSHYRLRFFNHGTLKLISMNVKKLVKKGDIQQKLTTQNSQHAIKTQNLAYQIHNWFGKFRKINMLDFQDLKVTQGYIQKYYSWEIFQTILCLIMSVFQIHLIQKMLKGNSVV